MGESFEHLPVMAREVVEHLAPVPAGTIVDCTVGGAGHATQLDAAAVLEAGARDRKSVV